MPTPRLTPRPIPKHRERWRSEAMQAARRAAELLATAELPVAVRRAVETAPFVGIIRLWQLVAHAQHPWTQLTGRGGRQAPLSGTAPCTVGRQPNHPHRIARLFVQMCSSCSVLEAERTAVVVLLAAAMPTVAVWSADRTAARRQQWRRRLRR